MHNIDPRVDKYIDDSQEFAKPILLYLRQLVHRACPEAKETMKWSFPHFIYKDANLCSFASFKEHCAFGFWLGDKINDPYNVIEKVGNTAMGHFGKIKNLSDLPSEEIMLDLISRAMILNEMGVKAEKQVKKNSKVLQAPDYLIEELSKSENALNNFNSFSQSCKNEYIEWLEDAKTEKTRQKRLENAVDWISEGKRKDWKYIKK